MCIRCGGPSHLVKDCPQPRLPILDPMFSTTFAKKPANIHVGDDSGESKSATPTPPSTTEAPSAQNDAIGTEGKQEKGENELYKFRGDFYRSQSVNPTCMVRNEWDLGRDSIPKMTGQNVTTESPLILLDSGASISVCGLKWLQWWLKGRKYALDQSKKHFRFGDGPLIHTARTTTVSIFANKESTDSKGPLILPIWVDVVDSNLHLVIFHESLRKMKGSIDFQNSALAILAGLDIQLTRTPSGRLMIPGAKPPLEMFSKSPVAKEAISQWK